jgi:hypothetical protein
MAEEILFQFEGKFASKNRMDFYEFARFQYSASRLLVKLDNFRRTGQFPKVITYKNDHAIVVKPFKEGSFCLEILAPLAMEAVKAAYEVPISTLFGYVAERVFKKAEDVNVREALQTQRRLIESFDANIQGRDDTISRTIELLRSEIEHERELTQENRDLYERLLAETDRRAYLEGQRGILRRFTPDQDADLITMAAPLLKEMNVPLRKSAGKVSVRRRADGHTSQLLFVNKAMADEVDIAEVDRLITTIDIDIIQYNKENGWGKFRNPEWEGTPSFNVPAEINVDIRDDLLAAMHLDQVEVDCYFVRSPAKVALRIIVVAVRVIDEI